MNKIERKINRTVQLAKNVRLHRADGGETDPMLNQDTSIYNNPYKDQVLSAPEPMTLGQYLAQAMRKPHETNIRDFPQDFQNLAVVQGIKQLPEQIWESVKYPTMARKGELQRGIDPHTGQLTWVTESGMGPTEAGMVGAGLVSAGAMPDIAAGRVTPNVMRAGSPVETTVGAVKAPRSDLGFYSHGSETAANLPQAKGTADQMVSMLRNQGVKPAELENAGLIDAAGNIHPDWAGKPVTREELSQHLHQSMPQVEEKILGATLHSIEYNKLNDAWQKDYHMLNDKGYTYNPDLIDQYPPDLQSVILRMEDIRKKQEALGLYNLQPPEFKRFTLPGGKNYREVALTLPGDEMYRVPSVHSMGNDADKNRLAHIRMADRVGPNGEKLLHVEEMQSDWGQQGKKEGFAGKYKELPPDRNVIESVNARGEPIFHIEGPGEMTETGRHYSRESAINSWLNDRASVLPAPYVTSTQGWTDLALKRVMKEAAEGGYDGVVFTPGAEQAKRYDLSKQVDEIRYMKNADGTYNVIPFKDGESIHRFSGANLDDKKLKTLVGEDVAKKIKADEGTATESPHIKSIFGDDLSVGTEGMKGYYDKIVPSRLKELMKGHDKEAKLDTKWTSVEGRNKSADEIASALGMSIDEINALPTEEKKTKIKSVQGKLPMLHMPMTDKMRQSILSGQKAFNEGGRVGFADGGSPPWGFDFNQPTIDFQPQQPSVPPLADLNLYKGAPLNKPPEPPQEEQKQEEDTVPAAPQRPEVSGSEGGASTTAPSQPDFALEMGPPASAAPSPFGGLATAAGFGPGVTAANTVGGLFGGLLGTAVAGPFGGLVGGLIGRHAANAISAQDEDEDEDADKSKSEDKTSNEKAGVENGGLGPATDATPEAAEQSGKSDSNAESATGNMQDGGAITVRRYRAAGGPIKLSPSHAEAGPSKISPAQAKAGNYKKKHLNFQGLPLAIETPKGHVREKIINERLDWRVKMPVDYGYVKGTKDNDGDATDVFVGPHKKSDKVWVIDQADHRTGKFDEHKAMLGFKHKHKALKAYKDSFSDGKAHKRIMDATKLSVQEYKDWIKHGDLKKPVSSSPFIQKALMVASKKS